METESEHYLKDDIAGRLRNTPLPYSHSLLPLFEAIVNSLQSLEDTSNSDKATITVYVHRSNAQQNIDYDSESKAHSPIEGFSVEDNGEGFNDQNFESFKTADSRLKEEKGGRGVGRFVWLKAFSSVQIVSIFSDADGILGERSFSFEPRGSGIQNYKIGRTTEQKLKTTVFLQGFREKYQNKTPAQPSTIAQKIIDHCIVYLLTKNCPNILLVDRDEEYSVNINDMFRKEVADQIKDVPLKLNGIEFSAKLLCLNSNYKGEHKVALCADSREVKTFTLKKLLPDISGKKIPVSNGEFGSLVVIVSSPYLDEVVNTEKTDFLFSRSSEFETEDGFDVSESALLHGVAEVVRSEFQKFFDDIVQEKITRIEEFAEQEEPEYRVLLKHARDRLETIPDGLDNRKLDTELHKILHDVELELKDEGREFINEGLSTALDSPEFKARYDDYVEKLLDLRQSELSKYVLHRRTIIELLGKLLQKQEGGKYALEDEIHKLLYPMRTSSSDAEFGQQNLWLIDEKLTYHYFLASDLEFRQMDKMAVSSNSRPDVLIIDRPASFVEGAYPYHSVVIIELKRPQRKNYPAAEKDPFDQVYGYIEEIKDGKIIGEDGAHVQVGSDTRFYCYIIADLTDKIRQKAKRNGFRDTIDRDGYFDFNENYNAYVEVISYRKLYEDARKRNKVLFDKLGLPTT